jgi:hypothetical protein
VNPVEFARWSRKISQIAGLCPFFPFQRPPIKYEKVVLFVEKQFSPQLQVCWVSSVRATVVAEIIIHGTEQGIGPICRYFIQK